MAAYLERGVRVALVVWLTGYGGTGCVVDKVRWYGMYGGIGGSVVMVVRVVRCGTGGRVVWISPDLQLTTASRGRLRHVVLHQKWPRGDAGHLAGHPPQGHTDSSQVRDSDQ